MPLIKKKEIQEQSINFINCEHGTIGVNISSAMMLVGMLIIVEAKDMME